MKKFLACILAVAMLLGVTCAFAEETLVIYSARNERLNNIVIPAFEAKTGIKVEIITGSSGEVLQRVKSEVETGNVTVDIHWAADETMLSANPTPTRSTLITHCIFSLRYPPLRERSYPCKLLNALIIFPHICSLRLMQKKRHLPNKELM